MINKRDKIEFIKENIAHFPELTEMNLIHGFSWGKEAGNMSLTADPSVQTRLNLMNFFRNLGINSPKKSLNIIPEHKDKIFDFNSNEQLTNLKQRKFGFNIDCDVIVTSLPNIQISVKPADCTTAILVTKTKGLQISGIIHSGWRGVDLSLPSKVISYLLNQYVLKPSDIKLFIVPGIFEKNRTYEHIDSFTNKKYIEKYIKKYENHYTFNERGCAINQYIESGIPEENIFSYEIDTFESAKTGESFSQKYWHNNKNTLKTVDGRFIVTIKS